MSQILNKNQKTAKAFLKEEIMLLFGIFMSFTSLTAQTTQVSGKVTDASSGEPLPGVSIAVEGTSTGAVTDVDGKFKVTAPANAVLVFSYISYMSERIQLQGQSELNVQLVPSIQQMDEVVVIGYGTAKRKDLTGSVSSMSGDKIKDIPVSSVAEALTGKLAGVQVTTTEGSPDAEIKIRVRGGGSITRDNTPLYIVDGFPVDRISDIPPTDIQSVDVLKDASSTAIYGARGANGVVIVTTKSAKAGKLTLNYNGYYGVKQVPKMLDVMSPYEFANWQYEQAVLQNDISKQYEAYFGSYSDMGLYKYMNGTDWQNEVFGRTGTTQSHSVSLNGGSDKYNFYASFNRIDDKAIMLGSNYARNTLNFKMAANPVSWVKANFYSRYTGLQITGGGANDVTGIEKSTQDSRLKYAIIFRPIPLQDVTSADDEPESASAMYPPTEIIADNDRDHQRKNFNLGGDFTANIFKWLALRSEVGYDYTREPDNRFFGLTTYFVTGGDAAIKNKPAAQFTSTDITSFRNANTLTASYSYNESNFSLMAGEETLNRKSNSMTDIIVGFPVTFDADKTWSLSSQGELVQSSNSFYNPDDKLLSFFGRFNYDFKGRYLVTATMRADGSSKFAPENRWGYFPSAALAWRISEESFLKGNTWLNNLKLRASYGTAGNNNIPALSYMQVYSSNPTTYLPGSLSSSFWALGSSMANKDLKWETTVTRNAGIDFALFNSRINGSVEYYINNTKDLLIDFPVAGTGYNTQTRNIGKTSNRGYEVTLDAMVLDQKDFRLSLNFNISINKNKVESLGGLSEMGANSAWTSDAQASNDYRIYVGKSLGLMYGYVTDGMYSTDEFTWNGTQWNLTNQGPASPDNRGIDGSSFGPGALKLKDLNGDGQITEDDRTIVGDAMPKHLGGFAINAFIKGFDISANFNWVYGNDIYNANKIEFTTANKYTYRNMLSLMNSSERWTNIDPATGARMTDPAQLNQVNANAKIWSPGISRYVFHSWAVEDGSFLRLNNLTIGYTIPRKWISKLRVENLRIYATAYNLFVWTNYSGYDPEVDSRRRTPLTPGVDYAAYPKSRTMNFGVNLTF